MYKYIEVKNQIKKYIDSLEVDSLLPSYIKLGKMFNISDTTVRKALSELQKEQLIYAVRRKGVFKAKPIRHFLDVSVITDSLHKTCVHPDSIFPWIIGDIEERLRENDLDMLLSCFGEDFEFEKSVINKIIERRPYGVIVNPSGERENFSLYEKLSFVVPNFVFIDRYIEGINGSYVGTASYDMALDMTSRLSNKEYDQIFVFVPYYQRKLNSEYERLRGYYDGIKTNNCKNITKFYDTTLNAKTMFDTSIKPYFKKKFSEGNMKKVLFLCVNTEILTIFYDYFREDIGKLNECKIVAFDRLPFNIEANTSVLWCRQNIEKISEIAVDLVKNPCGEYKKIYVKGSIREN